MAPMELRALYDIYVMVCSGLDAPSWLSESSSARASPVGWIEGKHTLEVFGPLCKAAQKLIAKLLDLSLCRNVAPEIRQKVSLGVKLFMSYFSWQCQCRLGQCLLAPSTENLAYGLRSHLHAASMPFCSFGAALC